MRFTPLASSSHGNSYIVNDEKTRILIECGIAFRTLQQKSGFCISSFDGCLISHEHKDHSRCVAKVIESGIPVYLSQGTAMSLGLPEPLIAMASEMEAWKQFQIGTITVLPFPTYHDTMEPLGFCLKSALDGETVAFAIDTVNCPYSFPDAQILAVEANYDPEFFRWLNDAIEDDDSIDSIKKMQMRKRCIRTMNTHMSIDKLCECLHRMNLKKCREIWLMHLSDDHSREMEFIRRVQGVVPHQIVVRACGR